METEDRVPWHAAFAGACLDWARRKKQYEEVTEGPVLPGDKIIITRDGHASLVREKPE